MGRFGLLPLLVLPAVAVNLLTFLWPMLNLAGLSFREGMPGGGIGTDFTMATWRDLLADEFYLEILLRSVGVSLTITGFALLAGYPLAFFVHRSDARWRNLLVVACISPLLISAVVRTYGWLVILGDRGFAPSLLRGIGIDPPRLVFNMTGVIIGLVEILMPYMILSLLAGFGKLNQTLEEAAASLGAPPLTVFWRIVLPLTLPGILLGCLLTFVLTISSFITPKLLGGGRVLLLATEIYDNAIVTLNWPLAAALSLIALGVFGAAMVVYGRIARAAERAIA
ncbi:putative spermidine/putrescine transport system permease protein [Humitalea rosea]|uniref:Putative spermidine/putrescine transport system permease protein n=1 Tax=Humitalea rosea TaxID=990373 RepID=A0A2W7IUI4_9PROT|nr:ABC transporter permease [Humitalea rosea]PZW51119.1 putative spermidine/putrescine transport system permease protein [Humitalea rosea]